MQGSYMPKDMSYFIERLLFTFLCRYTFLLNEVFGIVKFFRGGV